MDQDKFDYAGLLPMGPPKWVLRIEEIEAYAMGGLYYAALGLACYAASWYMSERAIAILIVWGWLSWIAAMICYGTVAWIRIIREVMRDRREYGPRSTWR